MLEARDLHNAQMFWENLLKESHIFKDQIQLTQKGLENLAEVVKQRAIGQLDNLLNEQEALKAFNSDTILGHIANAVYSYGQACVNSTNYVTKPDEIAYKQIALQTAAQVMKIAKVKNEPGKYIAIDASLIDMYNEIDQKYNNEFIALRDKYDGVLANLEKLGLEASDETLKITIDLNQQKDELEQKANELQALLNTSAVTTNDLANKLADNAQQLSELNIKYTQLAVQNEQNLTVAKDMKASYDRMSDIADKYMQQVEQLSIENNALLSRIQLLET